jgi:hypothetical protein
MAMSSNSQLKADTCRNITVSMSTQRLNNSGLPHHASKIKKKEKRKEKKKMAANNPKNGVLNFDRLLGVFNLSEF